MNVKYYMPTKVIAGRGCVKSSAALLSKYGKRALVMTGKGSAKRNGSLRDVEEALASRGIGCALFDGVESNPGIANCREAARAARDARADFIIGIGGGSPLDAAKAAAILALNELADAELFGGEYPKGALPVVALPTTAGTGSEVTQYAILTNDAIESKSSISWEGIFPALAFLDAEYTATLDARVAANTAMDALSHAVEGYLSLRSDPWSRAIAYEALRLFGRSLPELAKGERGEGLRSELLLASDMAGAVIAQTGTTIVHAMGYSLTYFKGIDHGRANGLLLGPYLEFIGAEKPDAVREVLSALGWPDLAAFDRVLDSLLGEREEIGASELEKFVGIAKKAKHVGYTARKAGEAEIRGLFEKGLRSSGRDGN
jgi:alcohol dehydrogenase class IV